MEIGILAVAFVVILIGAELFTNGIEWFGRKLELAEGAVGSVLAAVGTALPETMIPIIAILFAGGASASAVGVGAILGAPFMLVDARDVRDGRRRPVVGPPTSERRLMRVDTVVLAHDMRYFAIAYAIAIGAAFLPLEPVWLKWIVAVVLLGIYAWYVKGHFEAEPESTPRSSRRSGSTGSTAARIGGSRPSPRLRIVNLQVIVALGSDRRRRDLLRRCRRAPRRAVPRRRPAARPRHRADRDRAAREVQLGHLGPPGQGHAGDGQHHRRDGLPVDDPDRRRADLRERNVGRRARVVHRVRLGRDRVPVVGGDLHPDGPERRAARPRGCSSGACSTSSISCSSEWSSAVATLG